MKTENKEVSWLVTWCFEPSQSQGIISGLKETFRKKKKKIAERANKSEIRLEEESEIRRVLSGEFME